MLHQNLHLLEDLLDLGYRPGAVDELGDGRRAVLHVGRDEGEQRYGLSQEKPCQTLKMFIGRQ